MSKIIAVVVAFKSELRPLGVETIIIDNNKINRGFAKAVNIGIKKALSKKADKILLIDNGKIKEEGSHKELMEKGGHYAKLFKLQAEAYLEDN